jgi:hypothetical protein
MTEQEEKFTIIDSYRQIALILAVVFFALILSFIYTDFNIYRDSRANLEEKIDNYYYNGWKVKTLRHNFNKYHDNPLFISYIKAKATNKDLNYYRDELYQKIDLQNLKIREEAASKARTSAIFYIPQIKQDTTELEKDFKNFEIAADSQNKDMISWELQNIEQEIERLSRKQEKVIEEQIEKKQEAIEDSSLLASLYGLDIKDSIQEAESIKGSQIPPIEKFKKLDQIIDTNSSKLEDAILARGGQKSPDNKRIVIDISKQRLYMFEDNTLVYEMPASTGVYHHATVPGEFEVMEKIDMAWGYYEIWMPYWMTIYYAGSSANGIHGIPISPDGVRWSHWEDVVGVRPITYGCVMPKDKDAKKLYDWANVGTPVTIFY